MRARHLSILLLAPLTLLAACGGSDGSAAATTTSTKAGSGPSTSTLPSTTTIPKVPFASGLSGIQQKLADAKGDPCKLYDLSADLNSVENPASTEEDKEAVAILVEYFDDIADVVQTDHPADATAIRTTATKFSQQAEAAGFKLDSSSLTALDDTGFRQAFASFQQATSSCTATTTTAG